MDRYGRKYKLIIGRDNLLLDQLEPDAVIKPRIVSSPSTNPDRAYRDVVTGAYIDWITAPKIKIEITELRLKAKIVDSKKGSSNSNLTTIEIYNLSPYNQKFITQGCTVLLHAGYDQDGDEPPLIFSGQVSKASTIKKGEDTITTLACSVVDAVRRNVRVSKSPLPDETSKSIAEYFASLAAENGIPTGNVFVPVEIPYPTGYPAAGNLFNIMEEFCRYNNLKCYVTLGKLYIEPIDITPTVAKVKITENNVKGSIRPLSDGSSTSTKKSKNGIEVVTFLDGRISTSRLLSVDYGDYSGDYKITSVEFELDNEGNKWDTNIECEVLSGL